jgi:predicted transcriptional regulator of viral defense system
LVPRKQIISHMKEKIIKSFIYTLKSKMTKTALNIVVAKPYLCNILSYIIKKYILQKLGEGRYIIFKLVYNDSISEIKSLVYQK